MALVRLDDLITSFEVWLIDNWPSTVAEFAPAAARATRPFAGTVSDLNVRTQWGAVTERETRRAGREFASWDVRLICEAKDNDRLAASEIASELRTLLQDTVFDVVSRSDGTTVVGYARIERAETQGPDIDSRGITQAVVDVFGFMHDATA